MIGIGVIGYGYWGPNLVRNFAETEGARVVGVCDRRPERLDLARRRYPGIQVTADPDELIGSPIVDAVVVATPVSTHYLLANAALQAGKHVLIEKPMTATSDQSGRLIDLAGARGLTLMVDHTFVYAAAVRKIRELIQEGILGELYYYDSVRINLGLFQHDVNVVWDLAVHDLSIMDFLLGREPTAISTTGMAHLPGEPENVAYLTMFFDGPLIGHIHVNWLAPVKIRRTLVGGSRQMVVYDDLESSEGVRIYDKGVTHAPDPESVYQMLVGYRTGDMWAPRLAMTEALAVEARHFVECVGRGETPITNGEAGLRVVRMLEAATVSMNRRGLPVSLLTGAS
ncbi:MAG: Gfo/Idh/MocA family oxidoreductase [Acidobacteriota bacterium]